MSAKKSGSPSFSLVGELPKHSVPAHCCRKINITTVIYLISSAVLIEVVFLLLGNFYLNIILAEIENGKVKPHNLMLILKTLSIVAPYFLLAWGLAIVIAVFGVFKERHYYLLPAIIFEIIVEIIQILTCILWSIVMTEEHVVVHEMIIVCFVSGTSLLLHSYYIYALVSCYRHLKKKKETEEFIARQKIIDEVCIEMWEEEQERTKTLERLKAVDRIVTRQIEYSPESYSISDESDDYVFYQGCAQPYEPRLGYYEPPLSDDSYYSK